MADAQPFRHLSLRLVQDAPPRSAKPFPRNVGETTTANKQNRRGHGSDLGSSVEVVLEQWNETVQNRLAESLPDLPPSIPVLLRIDPDQVDPDELRLLNIEVVGELEDGFIIGASADALAKLSSAIGQFVEGKANRVAAVWELIEDTRWRPEHILSPELYERWGRITNEEWFIVDVSIACVGTVRVPDTPRRKDYQSDQQYQRAKEKYEVKRNQAYEDWDELSFERQHQLERFVSGYGGAFQSGFYDDGEDPVPNSFSCRVRLSGKALRDLVLNFPFVFEVVEPGDIEHPEAAPQVPDEELPDLDLTSPDGEAPAVCVIDSGIQEKHRLLEPAIDEPTSRSWVEAPTDVADYVPAGGHGTRVAGCVLYPSLVPKVAGLQAHCWIQNARILDSNNAMPVGLFPPATMDEVVGHFYSTGTKIYNLSINRYGPCRTRHMSLWASAIDRQHWTHDLLYVISAGNVSAYNPTGSPSRLGIIDHLQAGRAYPNYLLEASCRIADPGQSLQALTVGSIADHAVQGLLNSFAGNLEPSSFSRTGPGIWGTIKPEVVEAGGDWTRDSANPPNLSKHPDACPETVRSTLSGGPGLANDDIGTSYSAPKVAHVVAAVAKELPNEPALLYKALVVQSARWPDWAVAHPDKYAVVRHIGYGIPDLVRATTNSDYRITLITTGARRIQARKVHVYQVPIPDSIRNPAEEYEILAEITLTYKARTRRTRRNPRRYLSTWLSWKASRQDESPEAFAARMLENFDLEDGFEEGAGEFPWIIHERSNAGQVRSISRGMGTTQKDWAVFRSHQLRQGFCIAVIGHEGWDKDPEAYAEYALAVSIEAPNQDISIYTPIAVAVQAEIEAETAVRLHL